MGSLDNELAVKYNRPPKPIIAFVMSRHVCDVIRRPTPGPTRESTVVDYNNNVGK